MGNLYKVIYEIKNKTESNLKVYSQTTIIKKNWPPTIKDVEDELKKMHPNSETGIITYFPLIDEKK
jgi:hypothetical protein